MKTIKAAMAAGYRPLHSSEYGGERIIVKGHVLVKNASSAKSRTEWGRKGRVVPADAEPHAWVKPWRHPAYAVFRHDQTHPKRQRNPKPPELLPSVLAAVWTINRAAKRQRDVARKQYLNDLHGFAAKAKELKKRLYDLKGQALHYLVDAGKISIAGYHRFGENWTEVLRGEGYCFHRPCEEPEDEHDVVHLDEIEAKPRGAREPRLKDAIHTVEHFLGGMPYVVCYEWPRRGRIHMVPDWSDEDLVLRGAA